MSLSLGQYDKTMSGNSGWIRPALSTQAGFNHHNAGNTEFCPASATELSIDMYGRKVNPNTLKHGRNANCNSYAVYGSQSLIEIEQDQRISTPMVASSAYDTLNVGRNAYSNISGQPTPYGQYPGGGSYPQSSADVETCPIESYQGGYSHNPSLGNYDHSRRSLDV